MLLFLPEPAQQFLSITAGIIISIAQLTILSDVFKKKFKPGLLSWLGWTLLMGTSFVSQVIEKGWHWNLTALLLSTIGSIIILCASIFFKSYLLKKSDWYFLFLGLLCMVVYLLSKNAWLTTGFAILADFVVGIPTFRHAYTDPVSQRTHAWMLGLISWAITLLVCIGNSWLFALFPMYLFLFNGLMFFLTREKRFHTYK